MLIDKLTGDEDEPILELLNQMKTDRAAEKLQDSEEEKAEEIVNTKEKNIVNSQEVDYQNNIEEVNMLVLSIFKSLEKVLFSFAKGNIGPGVVKSLIELGSTIFSARKLYTKKRFMLRQSDRSIMNYLYKRLFTFNRFNLVSTLAPVDRVKKQRYLTFLNK
jgi:hypothetical protein